MAAVDSQCLSIEAVLVFLLDYVVAGLSRAEVSRQSALGSAVLVVRGLPRRAVSIDYSRSLAQELSSVGGPQSF